MAGRVFNISSRFLSFVKPRHFAKTRIVSRNQSSEATDDEFKLHYLDGEHKGIAVFAFCRPQAKNALGRNLVGQFQESLQRVKFDNSVRVLILRSEVKGIFCAGADLKERFKMKPEEVPILVSNGRKLFTELSELPFPSIAALDGIAVGGGLELVLCCDMRVASKNAKMGLVETKLAIIPGGGGTQRLPRLIGVGKAKELIYTGRVIDGQEASEIGLVNESVEQNETDDAAYHRSLEIAKEIAANGPVGVRMAKMAISRGSEVDLQTGMKIEELCYAQTVPTKDRIEGLTAFKEKRPPKYEGH